MVEKQEANINDTGVLSKEDSKINLKSWAEEREVTDYWDISGAMDSTPGGTSELCGNMKLQGAADEATAGREGAAENYIQNDNVTLTSGDDSNAMKTTYCENGQSAISETGMKGSGNRSNNNNNNSDNDSCVSQIRSIPESKDGHMSKNSGPFANSDEGNKDSSNVSGLLRESDTVGTEQDNTKGDGCDVNDTVSQNMMTSGAKDNCPDGENKAPLSIRDQMLLDSECTEERFRIDRKKLEQMLQAASEGRGQSGEDFFQKIMDDTATFITWPSKLKIGAKSKKDPHIRICGKPDSIKQARQRIMLSLDTKSNRVTIKMDVSHTEHSHVIGKGGNNIKRVMQETGCHIHFPDSNRNTAGEKSNQVSITGHPEGVESARTKIRSLLPIVIQFEIPNAGLPIPDLNSPIIQHLVQVYGISIQFKQRAKVYSTSCTVRGSADNTDGLKRGIQMLMTQVAGTQLPVQTQIEIAPQHHSYMLSKPGLNVTTISKTTGARIIFPDHNALPKKSTVYMSGTTIDSVILARHKLMGCLPLLLMFDMKDENEALGNDAVKIANLMETYDVSINIKSKLRQPSRTVIIKGIECNIYNMFEARGKLLGLDSSGVTRPAKSQSPKISTRSASITPTPVILLAHSHVPTPTVQTAVIGLTEQKPVTPIPILGNTNYVLTHSVPSNPVTPRPVSATLPTVHATSQSPFPTLQNGTIPNLAVNQHLAAKQNLIQRNEDMVNNTYPLVSNNMSPPTTVQMTRSASLPTDRPLYQVNVSTIEQLQQQSGLKFNMAGNGDVASLRADGPYVYQQNYATPMPNGNSQQRGSQVENFENAPRHKLYSDFPKQENSQEDSRAVLSNYDSRSIASLEQFMPKDEERIAQQNRDIEKKMNEHLMQRGVHYGKSAVILSDEDLLRQQLGMVEQSNLIQSSSNNSVPSSQGMRQSLVQSIRSPDSITESRASITSDRNSPLSSISDRYNGGSNPRLGGYDQFDEQSVLQGSPPANTPSTFQSLANRDINTLSPMSSHHRSPPQIVLNQNSHGGFEGNNLSENPTDLGDMYQHTQQSMDGISSGPPPGFEDFTPAGGPVLPKDYENIRKLAKKAMENKPVPSEVRTPTDIWSGWGFSKSMPFGMKEELKKLAASKGRFSRLPTTFENGEVMERNQPSPVEEEAECSMEQLSPNRLRVPVDTGVGRGGSNFKAWRRRRLANMNLSLGGNMGLNYMSSVQRPTPQKHSAFTPIHPNESLNRSSNSPKNNPVNVAENLQQGRQVISSPFNNSGNEGSLHVPLPDKPKNPESRINMTSTPTIQDSLGLTANSAANPTKVEPDIPDVLNRLGLSKFIPVFQQQEVDYQTFLTLTDPDLKELGITTFGPRKKILLAIKDLSKDRDVFSGPKSNDAVVHENLSDHMLQLQRLELQQHRDNPQTTAPSRLDSHALLSAPRQLFNTQSQRMQNHPDGPAMDSGFYEGNNQRNNDRMRSSRLWQNSRTGGSNSGRW